MIKELNLSDFVEIGNARIGSDACKIKVGKIKEFIRLLRNKIHNLPDGYDKRSHDFLDYMNKLAGKKLT